MTAISKNLYRSLWPRYISKIYSILNDSNKSQFIQLDSKLFSQFGKRDSYTFNLEYKNGIVSNDIGGSAVARDLHKIISKTQVMMNVLKKGHYKINLDKDFILHIKKL